MSHSSPRQSRLDYPWFLSIPTRWTDNDLHGHVNNAIYYSFFSTAINQFLLDRQLPDRTREALTFAVETHCQFIRSVSFPEIVEVGLRVGHLGNSSVRYELGVFKQHQADAVAFGHFVHVFVDHRTHQPIPIPEAAREALARLQVKDVALAAAQPSDASNPGVA